MSHHCDLADATALAALAKVLAYESGSMTGEARDGRLRLLQNVNSKLVHLGRSTVTDGTAVPPQTAAMLMARLVDDEELCAHTRNFLAMALSRLARFDVPAETVSPVL